MRYKNLAAAVVALGLVSGGLYHLEDNVLEAYLDGAKVPTICLGLTEGVKMGDKETEEGCRKRNAASVKKYEDAVDALIKVPVTPELRASQIWFAYNIGLTAYKNSTTLRLLNSKDYYGACRRMLDYMNITKDGKLTPYKGVINRRGDEQEYCYRGITDDLI